MPVLQVLVLFVRVWVGVGILREVKCEHLADDAISLLWVNIQHNEQGQTLRFYWQVCAGLWQNQACLKLEMCINRNQPLDKHRWGSQPWCRIPPSEKWRWPGSSVQTGLWCNWPPWGCTGELWLVYVLSVKSSMKHERKHTTGLTNRPCQY